MTEDSENDAEVQKIEGLLWKVGVGSGQGEDEGCRKRG